MSAIHGSANTAEVALAAATAKTVLQLVAAANHRVKVKSWGVSFDGISETAAPVVVELLRQTDAGTMSALTPQKTRPASETLQTTAQHTATAEPAGTTVVDSMEVHPQGGYEKVCDYEIGGGERFGIRCTAPAIVNVIGKMDFEE